MQPLPEPEFSFPIEIAQIPAGGAQYDLAVPADALVRVAARLGVVAVERLESKLMVKGGPRGVVLVSGRVSAALVQRCVVSLVPIPVTIDEPFEARFVAEDRTPRKGSEEDIPAEGDDPPEVAQEGRIDLGELAVAQVALVLDPYPRAPGVNFDPSPWADRSEPRQSPFAALAGLKKKPQG